MEVSSFAGGFQMFCHSPDSWRELWDGIIFRKGTVRVDTQLIEVERADLGGNTTARHWAMLWSVTRL